MSRLSAFLLAHLQRALLRSDRLLLRRGVVGVLVGREAFLDLVGSDMKNEQQIEMVIW